MGPTTAIAAVSAGRHRATAAGIRTAVEAAAGNEVVEQIVRTATTQWEFVLLYPLSTLFVLWLLRYETGMPIRIGVLFVPPIVITGFVVAYGLHVQFPLTMLQALGVLCSVLVPLLFGYEAVRAHRRDRPRPPSGRV